MDVVSTGPLPVASVLWQARPSTWVLTVVCKATFSLDPVEAPLAPLQEPICERDVHVDGDEAKSLREPGDLAPFKQGADVVLIGHAHAPGGQPVRSLTARMIVGDVDKPIQVFSDRVFTQQGELQEGPRFTRMSLAYERAAGGPDTSNPTGLSREAADTYGKVLVPNLLPVDLVVSTPADFIPVIGFGPIAASWPSRRQKLGSHAADFASGALPSGPLPEDFDRGFFSVAPVDQRLPELRDNERIVLENLHPDHPRLVTSLPGLRPRAVVTGRAGGPRDLPMRCDTLVIDTDRLVCTATWRGQLPLASPDEVGQVHVDVEPPAHRATAAPSDPPPHAASRSPSRPPPLPARPGAPKVKPPALSLGASTLAIDLSQPLPDARITPGTALPFRAGPPAAPPPPPARASEPPPRPPAPRPRTGAFAGTLELTDAVAEMKLPFAPAPGVSEPAPPIIVMPPSAAPPPPAAPVSPWAGSAPQPGTTPSGTIAPVASPVEAHSIGALLAGTGAAPSPAAAPATHRDALALVWFDRRSVPRIVRKPAWQRLLDDLEDEPVDPEADDPALSDEPAEIEDRAQVFEILDRAAATDVAGVEDALGRAAGRRGKLVPPLELCAGELVMAFDEVETLKAMVSTATPLAAGDEPLESAIAAAEKFLATPGVSSAPAVAEALSGRIREALARGKKGRAELVGHQVERALLEQRHYQKRKVLGGPHLRGLLQMSGETQALVAYLPEAIAEALPLAVRFRARMIAAVHPAVDEREGEGPALEAAALGRVVQLRRGR